MNKPVSIICRDTFLSLLVVLIAGGVFTPQSQSIADRGFEENIPVRFELPEPPSSNLLGDMVPAWYISVLAGKSTEIRVAELADLSVQEEDGKWYVKGGIPPNLIPSKSVFRIAYRDASEVFEPCTSAAEISTYSDQDIMYHLVVLFFLRYTRFTTITLANNNLTAEFNKDDIVVNGNRLRIKADPVSSASSHSISISAPGYHPVVFDLMIDRIGEPAELSVLLHTDHENMLFEKIAYLYQSGNVKAANGLVGKITSSSAGMWGYLQLYKVLVTYSIDKEINTALSTITSALEQAGRDNNYLLKVALGTVKTQLLFTSGKFGETELAVDAALTALDDEEAIFGVSRMEPPYFSLGVWGIRSRLKFFKAAAATERFMRVGNIDPNSLREEWKEVRRLTERISADSEGKELMKINPFEERIQYYENQLQ